MPIARFPVTPWVLFVLLSSSYGLGAQDLGRGRLAELQSLKCEFPVRATGTWTDGEPKADIRAETFSLQFSEISTEDGTAQLVRSRYGVAHIIARLSQGNLHLLQISSSGSLYATTVFDSDSRAGKLKAVHSRHGFIEQILRDVTSRPEQHYGECEIAQ